MGPPEKRSGPTQGAASPSSASPRNESDVTSVRHPYVVAVELLGDQADRERAIFEAAWSAGYRVGFEAGHGVGHERAHAEIADDWAAMAAEVRGYARDVGLQERRWGPGGRAHFGDPRPGDYPGEVAKRGAA